MARNSVPSSKEDLPFPLTQEKCRAGVSVNWGVCLLLLDCFHFNYLHLGRADNICFSCEVKHTEADAGWEV